jgi:hypothetical protein
MLLKNEIQLGEIYVTDYGRIISFDKEDKPQLFQMVQEPRTVRESRGLFDIKLPSENEINGIYENIVTGELIHYGTQCFSTLERIKKQFQNIDSITDEDRRAYVKEAYTVIKAHEAKTIGEAE